VHRAQNDTNAAENLEKGTVSNGHQQQQQKQQQQQQQRPVMLKWF